MSGAILVTGGAGYVGSHVCKALARAGFTPVTYDNLSRGHRWAVRYGPLEEGDTGDAARLDAVLARHRPAAAVHMAAFAYVGESVERPDLYYRNNVANSLVLFDALRARGVDALVFSSTCAVYGAPEAASIHEETPTRPINPYGFSKLMVERILADYDAAHGFRSVALRYFNAAGCDPEGEIGEHHDPEPHLIPRLLDAALGRDIRFTIHGDDYATPDGTCVRDYVHVQDLAAAHVLAVRRLLDGGGSDVFNLGSGHGFSIREMIDAARRTSGRDFDVTVGPRRPGDPPVLVAAAAKAESELGWRPERGSIDTVMLDAWRWHVRHFGN